MRFWFTLLLVVGIGFFAMRSCGSKLLGGGIPVLPKPATSPEKPERPVEQRTPPPPSAAPAPAAAVASPGAIAGASASPGFAPPLDVPAAPLVSAVHVFRHRVVPKRETFSSLLGSGGTGRAESVALVVDEPSNAVLIRGTAEQVAGLQGAVAALDVEALEAFCDAWILFVRGDRVRDFEAALECGGGSFGGALSSDGFGVSVPLGVLRGRLDILASNGVLEVVDRPQLRLSSGHRAEVSTGDEIPFPSVVVSNGIAQTSITFKRVGLSFAVKPLFLDGHRVRLEVEAENGLVGATQKIGEIEVPSISKQAVTAAATLGFDEAMVLGGLESVRREKRFGLFGQSEKQQAGRLYVALMLRSGYPKASPVIGPGPGLGIEVPGVTGSPGRFSESLLPARGWLDLPDGKPVQGLPLPEK